MREEFLKIKSRVNLKPCPYCGCENELWQHEQSVGYVRKVVMCSNNGDEDNFIEPCPMHMPPEGFYMATKREAVKIANTRSNLELEELADRAAVFYDDIITQIGSLCIQDFQNLNGLGILLTKHKKK